MANRSYLYSVDTVPELDNPPMPIRAISEHKWSIPLVHKLLAGVEPRVCWSMIWDHEIGIAADFAGGLDLTTRFLRRLADNDAAEHQELRDTVASILDFLAGPQRAGRYFVLETGEILALNGDDFAREVHGVVDSEIPSEVAAAEKALAGENEAWLADVRSNWSEHIGSFFSDVLYFSFS
jgi:hypothetical protein